MPVPILTLCHSLEPIILLVGTLRWATESAGADVLNFIVGVSCGLLMYQYDTDIGDCGLTVVPTFWVIGADILNVFVVVFLWSN